MSTEPESLADLAPAPLADLFPRARSISASPIAAGPEDDDQGPGGPSGQLAVATKPKSKRPSMYKVLLLNDDYTPMEFVVEVLEKFFGIRHELAVEIMLTVHRRGLAVVGVFSFEIAETKVTQVMDYAQMQQHPLQCTMEKE
ncbi:MAG: ATP-dependent Clp protease adaptor protein ClpS [Paracoccaceae bacterium]|jgi:ATP-dependent Clp protease adaptor protein ClpS